MTDWSDHTWKVRDDTVFPPCMTDFARMTFKQVYENDKGYVKFMNSVKEATGLFKAFQEYCKIREMIK